MADQEYEWDEAKRAANIIKHGLDFLDAPLIFEGPHLLRIARTVEGELREIATGLLNSRHVLVVFTRRSSVIRIISFRRDDDGGRGR